MQANFKAIHPHCVLSASQNIVLYSLDTAVYLLDKTAMCFGYRVQTSLSPQD
jgi:hypothetical protein